jgi:hypothetical protein
MQYPMTAATVTCGPLRRLFACLWLIPQFERAAGHKLIVQYQATPVLGRRADRCVQDARDQDSEVERLTCLDLFEHAQRLGVL